MIYGVPTPITLPMHTHYFKNLPLSLLPHPEAVRENMVQRGINSRERIAAADVLKNSANCEGGIYEPFGARFESVAKNKVEGEEPGGSAGMYMLGTPKCKPISQTKTEITVTFGWQFKGRVGVVKVVGTIEDGVLVSGPK
jgi:hypothetical protein